MKNSMKVLCKHRINLKEYNTLYDIEVGLVLSSQDVVSCHRGKISLQGSYIKINNLVAYLYNVHVSGDKKNLMILMKKKEIISLYNKMKDGFVAIPIILYKKQNLIKCEINVMKYDRSKGKDKRKEKLQNIFKKEKDAF